MSWHWFLLLAILIWIVWVGSGAMEGYMEFKSRPREAMEWCHRHGYFRKEHVMQVDGMTTICPVCWREAWVKAGKEKK